MAAYSAMPTLGPGSRLGQYEIVAPLRAGGMATLFLGRRVGPAGFARHVAIKVVHAHLASDPSFIEMFLDEARLAAAIQHPNVVHTEELGEENGMYYLAMEYVHGCSLAQFLMRLIQQKRGLAPEVAAHIAMKIADGLHAAHEVKDDQGRALGVVHRDISPQNVLLAYNGQVKLIDFGVAKAAGRSRETTGASLKGKIRYMSPEQAWGRSIDRRTDVYALGIVLWESLTHRRLFAADDDFAALERVRNPQVPPPTSLAPWIGEGLDHAVMTALAPDPAARFQTAQALRRAIGGGCPKAVMVEPDDLGALLMSVMEEDIEHERRSAPPAVTRALDIKPPEPARRTGALAAFTREMPAYDPAAGEALTAAEVPSARASGPAGAPGLVFVSMTPSRPGWEQAAPSGPPVEDSRIRSSSPSDARDPIALPQARGGAIAIAAIGLVLLAVIGGVGAWLVGAYWFGGAPPAPTTTAAPIAPPPVPQLDATPVGAADVVPPGVAEPLVDSPPPTRRGDPHRTHGETRAPQPEARAQAEPEEAAPPSHLPSSIVAPAPSTTVTPAPPAGASVAAPRVAPAHPIAPPRAPAHIAPAHIAPVPAAPAPIAPAPRLAPRHTPDGPYLSEPTF